MRYQRPGSVIFGKCFAIAFIIFVPLGHCLLQNAMDLHNDLEREQAERRRPPMENSDCQVLFRVRKLRVYLHAFTEAEISCQQGYAFSCIMRGFLALEYGEIMNEMAEARKTAEEYFKKGCAMKDLPVCRVISETRRDGRPRDLHDEARIKTGILIMGCELGSPLACGDAARTVFNAGDYEKARIYGARGCAMKDSKGNSYLDPPSCRYRSLALKKLAETAPGTGTARAPANSIIEKTGTADEI